MKNIAIITGYPRCRSAWFANLFTFGRSFFFHDPFAYSNTLDEVRAKLESIDADTVGIADPACVYFWPTINEWYPNAQWIVILRPFQETVKSCQKAFHGTIGIDDLHTASALLSQLLNAKDAPVFDFHNLNKIAIKEIARMCHADYGSEERLDMLMRMQVQVEPRHLSAQIERLKTHPPKWLQKAA